MTAPQAIKGDEDTLWDNVRRQALLCIRKGMKDGIRVYYGGEYWGRVKMIFVYYWIYKDNKFIEEATSREEYQRSMKRIKDGVN